VEATKTFIMKRNLSSFGTALSRNEAKQIVGGTGTCQAKVMTGNGSYTVLVGLSADDAEDWATATGGRWCCTQCPTATWSEKAIVEP
jgi:hypothetical protein